MWPWEHAAIGYVVFSVLVHLARSRPPTGSETVVVGFASVLPDLIDKPLAWEFGVFPSGYGIAHSIFFAIPLVVAACLLSLSYGRSNLGIGAGVGYLIHLPMDVLPVYVQQGRIPIERVLWPVRTSETSYPDGFSGTFVTYFGEYLAEFLSDDPSGYVIAIAVMVVGGILLWTYDGMPGVREPLLYLFGRRGQIDDSREEIRE